MRLSVVSWNIHKGIGGVDRRYRIDRVVAVLAEVGPDVALLQEVTDGLPRAAFHDQAELLAEALAMEHVAFGPQHRFAIGAHLRVKVGSHTRTVALFNLHLGLAGSERASQLARFLESEQLGKLQRSTPVVVGGDLNDLWGSLGPRFLGPAGFERAGRMTNTFPAAMPIRPLDGIFFRGDLRAHGCTRLVTPLTRQASDHLPLHARLELTT